MPSRFVSLLILVYWSVAAFFLLTWEVIPELTLGNAPDLRDYFGWRIEQARAVEHSGR